MVLAVVVGLLVAGMAAVSLRSRAVKDPLGDTYRLLRERLQRAGVPVDTHCGPRDLNERSRRALSGEDARRAAKLLARYESMRYSRAADSVGAADIRALRRAVRDFNPMPNPE